MPPDSPSHLPSERGVWYACGTANTLPGHGHVYSGPMATYCAWHRPMAVYAPAVNRTYFVYGNADNAPTICTYEHSRRAFAAPVVLGANADGDAHRNPTLLIDEDGFLYVFWGAHGDQPTRVVKSVTPYDITNWRVMPDLPGANSTYPQPWQLMPGELFVCHRHAPGWNCMFSRDGGESWHEGGAIVSFPEDEGWAISVYGMSVAETGEYPRRVHFVWSKLGGGSPEEQRDKHLWARRYNVYYACSDDGGRTWQRSDGARYDLPITEETAEQLFHSGEHGVWLKDIQLDSEGNPYILFLDADVATFQASWMALRHTGTGWTLTRVTESDHMYDAGGILVIDDDDIRIWGPSAPSQPGEDGGEIEEWRSTDGGETWALVRRLTEGSQYSHNHVKVALNHQQGPGDLRAIWSYGDSNSPPETTDVRLLYYGDQLAAPREIVFPPGHE